MTFSKRFWKNAMRAALAAGIFAAALHLLWVWVACFAVSVVCYRQTVKAIDREFYEAVQRLRGGRDAR